MNPSSSSFKKALNTKNAGVKQKLEFSRNFQIRPYVNLGRTTNRLITNQKVQTELYILSYLLKGRVYHGNLWELVGERSIEVQQEETLRRHQSICNGVGGRHTAVETFLMDERKRHSVVHVGLLTKHGIRTPSAARRHSTSPLACLSLACAPLACSISTREIYGTSIVQNDITYIAPSLSLLSTWATAHVQNAFYEVFDAELDMQSELMTKSLATRHSNAYLSIDHAWVSHSNLSSHMAWDEPINISLQPEEVNFCNDVVDVDVDDIDDAINFDFDLDECPDDLEAC
ncbi:hypothetical protein BDR05DRAFT_948811 [Suillus weaverae]|nr:hypothetical protein BDR05DRAFT_948811 [Suillus weaverae]